MPAGEVDTRSPATRRRSLAAALALALVAVVVAAGSAWWLTRGPSGPYAEAMDTLSEETARTSFTDWSRVAQEVDIPDAEEAREPEAAYDFLSRAYDTDLVTGSTQLDVIEGLAVHFGYTPAQAEWEVYGQSPDGAVDVLKMTDEVDFEAVADSLEDAGYDAPEEDDGVWRGDGDLVVQLEPPLTTLQINVLLLADERIILTSDDPGYLEDTRAVIRGDEPSLRGVPGVDPLLESVDGAVSAQLWARDFACEDLSMGKADSIDEQRGADLVEQAGGVHPLAGLLMARTGGEAATIAMWFDSEADADADLQPRTDLARGPAPGQGGDFTERFSVEESRVDGRLVTMRVRAESDSLMSDLGQGPVVFAAC